MKDVEIPGEVPGEIRAGEGIAAATIVGVNLRRTYEKIVNPGGTATDHRDPKLTRRRLLPKRPSDR